MAGLTGNIADTGNRPINYLKPFKNSGTLPDLRHTGPDSPYYTGTGIGLHNHKPLRLPVRINPDELLA